MNSPPTPDDFPDWYRRTSPRLYGYVRRYCLDADCDDIVAEVYLVAWRRRDSLPADAMPFLIGTARRALANHWRSRGRRARLAAELSGTSQLAAPDSSGAAVERADILAAVSRLRPEDREVLLLSGWDGLDAAGLSVVLACSQQAARARLSRARRRLAAELDGRPASESPTPEAQLRLAPEVN